MEGIILSFAGSHCNPTNKSLHQLCRKCPRPISCRLFPSYPDPNPLIDSLRRERDAQQLEDVDEQATVLSSETPLQEQSSAVPGLIVSKGRTYDIEPETALKFFVFMGLQQKLHATRHLGMKTDTGADFILVKIPSNFSSQLLLCQHEITLIIHTFYRFSLARSIKFHNPSLRG